MAPGKTIFGISAEGVDEIFKVDFSLAKKDHKMTKKGEIIDVEMTIKINANLLSDIYSVNGRPVHNDGIAGVNHLVSNALLHFHRERKKMIKKYMKSEDYAAYMERKNNNGS